MGLFQAEINGVFNEFDRLYSLAASKMGLSDSAFDILYALSTYGDGCTQKELCERCWTGKQTLNSSIKRLAAQGIISLKPGHGRETLVTLTHEGRSIIEGKINPFIQIEAQAFDVLDETEQNMLSRSLSRISAALRTSLEKAGML